MRLFSERQRDDKGFASFSGSSFEYLDSSARKSVERARILIERWFGSYPEDQQSNLAGRFRTEFDSAFFELAVHALLLALGCTVDVHGTGQSTSAPDFLATPADGSGPFYVEAKVVTDMSPTQRRTADWENRLCDDFNGFFREYRDYWFMVGMIDGRPTGPLSKKRITTFVDRLLAGVPSDKLRGAIDDPGPQELGCGTFQDAGFSTTVRILMRPKAHRAVDEDRVIVANPPHVGHGGGIQSLYGGIVEKAQKYGQLGTPFVVAVNATSQWISYPDSIVSALLGDAREPKGAFFSRGQPVNTRASAVLFFQALHPSNVPVVQSTLFHHPAALHAVGGPLLSLPAAHYSNGSYRFDEGRSLRDIFSIPDDWGALRPEED